MQQLSGREPEITQLNAVDIFQTITRTRKKVQWVLITCNGFKPNTWSEDLIDIALDADEIFGGKT